jgi:myo-inositol 2-dehydrogenase/D-chiro-inositol 1-dehydrogenase
MNSEVTGKRSLGMKQLQIGIIGCGAIGHEHVRRIQELVPEGKVVAATDYFPKAAKELADRYQGIKVYQTGEELIAAPEVEAIIITSSDESHATYVLDGIAHNKFVFCEKPMAQTVDDCKKIMEAEQKAGRCLVQVGFMRRYDRGYMDIKKKIDSGKFGKPLIIHCCHRNVSQASGFTTDYAVTRVAIHEIDISRWLLDDEYESVQILPVHQSRATKGNWLNPQIMLLTTKSGQQIDVEVQTDGAYAYDIQCQVVCENGTVSLPDPAAVIARSDACIQQELMTDWSKRFIEAYDTELKLWTRSVLEGTLTGPTAWDGYMACATGNALIKSRTTGKREKVQTIEKPALYC